MGHHHVTRTWNTTGCYSFEVGPVEILIHFTSWGYNDPGRTWGCPDDRYPPESSDERALHYAECVIMETGERIPLDDQVGADLFTWKEKEIYASPLDDDRDDDRD